MRRLFTHEQYRADVAAILRQVPWPGDVKDLRHAAMNVPMVEWPLPPGTRMPFMSARKDGAPRMLRDVLWAGKEPAPAYTFEFITRDRCWRCVTPKPCSNFYLEDPGPAPRPGLRRELTVPAEVNLCEPFPTRVAPGIGGDDRAERLIPLAPGCHGSDGRDRRSGRPSA